ncbi:MAG: hypothetical protein L3J28_01910 [Candidatus Polarisedimenticolaceae bacterium]|nr:hypothetical protein [Candidatus Polarisedimenticolaceae bacterium]
MRNITKIISACLLSLSVSQIAYAAGETPFPADWKSWTSVTTTLTTIGALPGCDADVSSFPPIYQETVETYCAVRPQGPGAVAVLVKPDAMASYTKRDGKLVEGSNMILHLKELQLLFVTGLNNGAPAYAVFKEDGTDATGADGILSANTCRVCHTGYGAFCVNGQCGTLK